MKYFTSLDNDLDYYWASPYSHPDKAVMEARYQEASDLAVEFIKEGFFLIEPIAMCHHKDQLPKGYEYWKTRDRRFIKKSDAVIVCLMDGWKESVGVTDEIAYAKELGKPVYGLDPKTLNIEVL
jgi:nucleoside 2-deoxyribosyltransferase